MSYENVWIKNDAYPYNVKGLETTHDVFNEDFEPVQLQEVNILNEGLKLVRNDQLIKGQNIKSFSVFIQFDFITMGVYSEIDRPGPFKYINQENEEFALVISADGKDAALINAAREIKLNTTENYRVEKGSDGLYAGYEIVDNPSGQLYSNVFCYNYVLFAINYKTMEIIEFDVRKPHSGRRTKAVKLLEKV